MSFMTIPTIVVPGIGEMTLPVAYALSNRQYREAWDMMQEHVAQYSEAHPQLVTALQTASLVGGAAGLYHFLPLVTAALGPTSIQGMTIAQLAMMQNSGTPVGPAVGAAGSLVAAATAVAASVRHVAFEMQEEEYNQGNYQRYDTQRERWKRLEEAELQYRGPGAELQNGGQVVYPFNPLNPYEHYEKARQKVEAAREQRLSQEEITQLEIAARKAKANSHIPYQPPSESNGNQGAFSKWFVDGESNYWLETFEYGASDGHVPRNEQDENQFVVGVNPNRDAPYQLPNLSKGTADAITAKEDSPGAKLTLAQMQAIRGLEDVNDVTANEELELVFRAQAIQYILFSREQEGRPTTEEALRQESNFEATLEITMNALSESEVDGLVSDAEKARMGLTAEYDENGLFTGYRGLAPRPRPEAGFYGVEDSLNFY